MEENLITFKTAKLAKEKGFYVQTKMVFVNYYMGNPEPPLMKWKNVTNEWYEEQNNFMATVYYQPTQALLQKWLLENYNMWVGVYQDQGNFDFDITSTINNILHFENNDVYLYNNPFDVLEVGLQEALKLIELKLIK